MTAFPISAKREFLEGVHARGDVFKVALFNKKAKLDEKTTQYSTTNEMTGKGYEAGGLILSGYTISEEKGSAILSFTDPVWVDSSITAKSLMVYNSSKGNAAIAVYDFEEVTTSTNGEFTAQIPQGLIRFI